MNKNLTPIASAVAILMLSAAAHAQQTDVTPAPTTAADGAQQVVVTGIRASLQKSLEKKRDSDSHIEVLTAEDIGKLPDKNVADSLSHLPGVMTETSQGSEGGFGENDRVSMRGTSSSLTQTLINGHNIASGDWFVLGQYAGGDVGRSVSYTLLPSELVGEVDVYKTATASQVEGGLTGSVDLKTRKPLDFQKQLTVEGSIGADYNTLAKNTDPQFNGTINWKNDANTFGFLLTGFDEQRHFERQGQETVGGFLQIAPGSAIAKSNPDLSGAYYPSALGSALFEQKRERKGGTFDAQMKITSDLTVDVNGFISRMNATNFNDNYMFWGKNILQLGAGQAPLPGYTTSTTGGITTLTSAQWAPVSGTAYGVYDQIVRPDEGATSDYLDIDLGYRVNDHLKFKSSMGVSYGHGLTPVQNVLETNVMSPGGGYSYNGIGSSANVNFGGNNNLSQSTAVLNWIFGDQNVDVADVEKWGQIDGTFTLNDGVVNDIQFGIRESDHSRSALGIESQHPLITTSPLPPATGSYPAGFGSGLGGGLVTQIWTNSPAQIAAYDAANASVYQANGQGRSYWQHDFSLQEKSQAAYVQADMSGDRWSGNVGLRLVRTQENVIENVAATATTPGANTASAFGPYVPTLVANTYNDALPSMNLRFDVTKDLVARFAASTTMTRPDYSALAGTLSLDTPTVDTEPGSGTGSNPNLKPVKSNNFDTSLEWYFAPRSLLSASVFYMDLTSYVGFSTSTAVYNSFGSGLPPNGAPITYTITGPVNTSGKVEGAEFSYEAPLPVYTNFGVQANATFVNSEDTGSDLSTCLCDGHLVGTSKQSGTVSGYYEDDRFNARLSVNYRSSSYLGLSNNTPFYDAGGTTVAASAGYKINEHLVLSLDGQNLNNPTLRYYGFNESQMRAIYKNGATYFLTLRGKM